MSFSLKRRKNNEKIGSFPTRCTAKSWLQARTKLSSTVLRSVFQGRSDPLREKSISTNGVSCLRNFWTRPRLLITQRSWCRSMQIGINQRKRLEYQVDSIPNGAVEEIRSLTLILIVLVKAINATNIGLLRQQFSLVQESYLNITSKTISKQHAWIHQFHSAKVVRHS